MKRILLRNFISNIIKAGHNIRLFWTAEPKKKYYSFPPLKFSHDSGVYPNDTITVTVTAPEGYTVAFRTDGTLPTAKDDSGSSEVSVELAKNTARYLIGNRELQIMKDFSHSKLLDDPSLPSGVMFCAAAVDAEGKVGKPEIKTYFPGLGFNELYPDCLVLSVMTDPAGLLDYNRGILATGAVYDKWRKTKKGKKKIKEEEWWSAQSNSTQRGRKWERTCTVQIYDGKDSPAVELAAGIRIQGYSSRNNNQKSFNLYFRSDYGEKRLNYELFPGIPEYKSFTLRNGGDNVYKMKYLNALLQKLVSDRPVTVESFRPAVLFLNGEYWGPYMLSEKISSKMLHDHYGIKKDKIIVIKDGKVEVGKEKDLHLYKKLLSFAKQDLTRPEVYSSFCSVMDVRSFAYYYAIQIYIGDADWNEHDNNILWKTRDSSYNGGKWQYIFHDIEYSCGLHSDAAVDVDHYHKVLEKHPLFAAAIRNDDFYALFFSCLVEVGTHDYSYENVSEAIKSEDDMWRPMMEDYYKRFGDSMKGYDKRLETTLGFFEQRSDFIVSCARKQQVDI